MIFILNEQIMNGTVTLQIMNSGIKAKNFELAIKHLMHLPFFIKEVVFYKKDKDDFYYRANSNDDGLFVSGHMKNKSLKFV